jgi:hypothetical protein
MKRFLFILALVGFTGFAVAEEYVKFRPVYSEEVSLTVASSGIAISTQAITSASTVRVVCSAACFVALTHAGITDTTSHPVYLPAGIPEYFHASPGEKIAGTSATGSATLYLNHMSR